MITVLTLKIKIKQIKLKLLNYTVAKFPFVLQRFTSFDFVNMISKGSYTTTLLK